MIKKDKPHGLTDSWNIGYRWQLMISLIYINALCRIAKAFKYKYIIFSNNDVLVPHGAIDATYKSLQSNALVVPLTTKKGAGHNPKQVL